jgi:hypothetical protein
MQRLLIGCTTLDQTPLCCADPTYVAHPEGAETTRIMLDYAGIPYEDYVFPREVSHKTST